MDKLTEVTFSALLDPASGLSLQEQVHASLRAKILSGILGAGARLPSTRLLADLLAVSRNTILGAYDQLIAEGYLETQQGSGTYVGASMPDTYTSPKSTPQRIASTPLNPPVQTAGPMPGTPALDQFPRALWARLVSRVWRTAPPDIMEYSDPAGYRLLREAIIKYLNSSRGVVAHPDQILIVSGLQQGLRLITESLLAQTDPILLEDPGYEGMWKVALKMPQPVFSIPVDEQGTTVPAQTQSSLLVTCPSRQYPLGVTMPVARRLDLLTWAQETNSLILEDDYDSEFRYRGRPLAALQGLDGGDRVIYGGSFSKTVFPALRLGYLVLPEAVAEQVIQHRETMDSFPSIVSQLALSAFIREGHFASHIKRLRKVHAQRQAVFQQAFATHLSNHFTLLPSDTGLHFIALPKEGHPLDDDTLAEQAQSCGIGASSLSYTYKNILPQKGLILGFANMKTEQIEPALIKFAAQLAY